MQFLRHLTELPARRVQVQRLFTPPFGNQSRSDVSEAPSWENCCVSQSFGSHYHYYYYCRPRTRPEVYLLPPPRPNDHPKSPSTKQPRAGGGGIITTSTLTKVLLFKESWTRAFPTSNPRLGSDGYRGRIMASGSPASNDSGGEHAAHVHVTGSSASGSCLHGHHSTGRQDFAQRLHVLSASDGTG